MNVGKKLKLTELLKSCKLKKEERAGRKWPRPLYVSGMEESLV